MKKLRVKIKRIRVLDGATSLFPFFTFNISHLKESFSKR